MNLPNGHLWVDPDGVDAVGGAYQRHVEDYDQHLERLADLRERGPAAWGNDDMGKKFSAKFLQGMTDLEGVVGGVRGTLDFTAASLRDSGRLYREADDLAQEAGETMNRDFEARMSPAAPARLPSGVDAEGVPLARGVIAPMHLAPGAQGVPMARGVIAPMHLAPGAQGVPMARGVIAPMRMAPGAGDAEPMHELQPTRMQRAYAVQKPVATPFEAQRTPAAAPMRGEPTEFLRSHAPIPAEPAGTGFLPSATVPLEPMIPAEPGLLPSAAAPPVPALPVEAPIPAERLTPMQSSHLILPEFATAHVDGRPLPEGYRLEALNPLADGNTRIDVNRYESVTPLAGATVTTPEGQVIDVQGRQLFAIRENPAVDPAAPGYQPLVVSYAPDGTPGLGS